MNSIILFGLIFLWSNLYSQQQLYPIYITGDVPFNEYTLFANSGWDGNWYVGYNMCWIKMFPKERLPQKEFVSRVFVGVKLGRAKTQVKPGLPPWEKEVIDGNIYVGFSSTPAWKSDQRYFLCSVKDIPTEGDWENALTTTGESRWFYTEIPIKKVNFDSPIWVCVYSNTPYLTSASSSPILAGGWKDRQQQSDTVWLNNDITGAPPINPATSLKTSIRAFEPAIILKFIPQGAENNIPQIQIVGVTEGRKDSSEQVFYIKPLSSDIERVWAEVSKDKITWKRVGKILYSQPFVFNLSIPMVPQEISGDFHLRFASTDIFENVGYTSEVQLNISRPETTTSQPPSAEKDKLRKKKK